MALRLLEEAQGVYNLHLLNRVLCLPTAVTQSINRRYMHTGVVTFLFGLTIILLTGIAIVKSYWCGVTLCQLRIRDKLNRHLD